MKKRVSLLSLIFCLLISSQYLIAKNNPLGETISHSTSLEKSINRTQIQQLTIYVKHDATGANDGSSWANAYINLQDAIDAAAANDEVWVAAGTYLPTRDINGLAIAGDRKNAFIIETDKIKIYGGFSGTETSLSQRDYLNNLTILSGDLGVTGDSTDNAHTVVYIKPKLTNSPISNETRLDGFTIEEANADILAGAGILLKTSTNSNNEATIANCIIKDNFTAFNGGGANVFRANPTFYNCRFKNNRVEGASSTYSNGGGLYLSYTNSSLLITKCTFEDNSSSRGGAIYFGTSAATIDSSTFLNNFSTFQGGGIYSSSTLNNDTVFMKNSQFVGNRSVSSSGGAIYRYASQNSFMKVENCTFIENRASSGGALYLRNNSGVTKGGQFDNCIFNNNSGSGSAMFLLCQSNANMKPEFNNCLIYDNRTSFSTLIFSWAFNGGDVEPQFNNCTIAGNSETSAALYHANASPFYNNCIIWGRVIPSSTDTLGLPTFTNSLIKGGGANCWNPFLGIDNGGNIDFEPMFADTANANFALLAGSPAINAGANDSVSVENTADIINNPRIFDTKVDLGAYEYQAPTTLNIGIDSISVTNPQCPSSNGLIVFHATSLGDVLEYSIDNGATWQASNSFSTGVGSYDLKVRLKNNLIYERAYSCVISLTAGDNVAPAAISKNISIYLNSAGQATLTPSSLDNNSTDNCDTNLSFSANKTAFTCADLGANSVILTATDDNGNSDTAFATVTVLDTISPIASATGTTIFLDGNGNASLTVAQINNGSSDACDANPTLSINKMAFTCADLGANNVTLTVTDANGNFNTKTVIVTVADAVSPMPVSQNVTAYLNGTGQVTISANSVNNNSTDNCLSALTFSLDVNTFNCTNLGANTVNFTVTDAFGNASSTTATVTIVDTVAPVMATQNITINLDASGNASITAANIDNGTTDNCTNTPTFSLNKATFTCSDLGANTVILTATDANGNTNTKTAIVTVVDAVAPVMAVQNMTINLNAAGNATITAANIDNGTTDNCTNTPTLSLNKTVFSCSDLGANTVTLTATDASGNANTQTATVTVLDVIAPIMATQNITIQLDATGNATITTTDIDNGTTDNCTNPPTFSLDKMAFDCSDIGANTVTLTATDASGNSNTQTATVTVEDNVVPDVSASNLTISLDENGDATITLNDVTYNVSDNCDPNPALSLDVTSFSCADLGENTVTITALDIHGNSNSETFTVTVIDEIAPTITCQPFEWRVDGTGLLEINPDDLINDIGDNCSFTTFATPANLEVGNIGENVITVTVEDEAGNQTSCQSVVTVLFNCVGVNAIVTPNGDGKNDTWLLECLGAVNNEVLIYNDLGQLIFQATNYTGNWAGRNMEGVDLPQAAYFYIIKVVINGQERLFKGNITLLR